MRALLLLVLLPTLALAANKGCPTGTIVPSTDTVTARAATAIVFQGVFLTSTPTVVIQICCVGDCNQSTGSWVPITGGSLALSAGTPTLAVAVANPTCMYRAIVSGGTATVGYSCAGP